MFNKCHEIRQMKKKIIIVLFILCSNFIFSQENIKNIDGYFINLRIVSSSSFCASIGEINYYVDSSLDKSMIFFKNVICDPKILFDKRETLQVLNLTDCSYMKSKVLNKNIDLDLLDKQIDSASKYVRNEDKNIYKINLDNKMISIKLFKLKLKAKLIDIESYKMCKMNVEYINNSINLSSEVSYNYKELIPLSIDYR